MKQALLITAYKDFNHLIDLIEYFDDRFKIFIHIDKKSELNKTLKNQLESYSNVIFLSQKYKVNWGGRNHLLSILLLAKRALIEEDIERFHTISGHDYPVKSLNYFNKFFKEHKRENFLEFHSLPSYKWPNGGLDRLMYYNLYDTLNAKKYRKYIFKLVKLQERFGVKRSMKRIPNLYGGETWWSLTREALQYVINYSKTNEYLLRRMKFSFCSEEMYVHTILVNSHLANTLVNDSLRYIDWNSRNGNFPANLDISDLESILQSNKLFARKFEFPISQELKLAIQNKNLK